MELINKLRIIIINYTFLFLIIYNKNNYTFIEVELYHDQIHHMHQNQVLSK